MQGKCIICCIVALAPRSLLKPKTQPVWVNSYLCPSCLHSFTRCLCPSRAAHPGTMPEGSHKRTVSLCSLGSWGTTVRARARTPVGRAYALHAGSPRFDPWHCTVLQELLGASAQRSQELPRALPGMIQVPPSPQICHCQHFGAAESRKNPVSPRSAEFLATAHRGLARH